MPVDRLRRVCDNNNIELIESSISDIDGFQTLYIGTYQGTENLNLCSLSPDWWGASTETRQVKSMTLSSLLSSISARKVTFLKLDVEGMEVTIIRQFLDLPESLLPSGIMFEYGGGSSKNAGEAGWSNEFIDATKECLNVLKECGYSSSVLIDRAPTATERFFDLSITKLDPDQIFDSQSIYGNIISFRNIDIMEYEMAKVCAPYRDNNEDPPAITLPQNPPNSLQKTWWRLRRLIRV
jgi:FkbM family methyltransferase